MLGFKKQDWAGVRDRVKNVDPILADIIDDLSPSQDYFFYVAHYPYGAMIVEKGVFHIPNHDKDIVPLSDGSVSQDVKEQLGYNKMIPTGLVTKNSIETYFLKGNSTISSSLYGEGDMVALWHVLEGKETYQTGPIWNISSGSRTIYMIPKISDKTAYHSLKTKYNLKIVPKSLHEHWDVFKYLANHTLFPEAWFSEVVYFSKKWFEKIKDPAFAVLFRYLLHKVWDSSLFRRNQSVFDFAFSLVQKRRNLKPNPYLSDTAKHLFTMADGFTPGLAVAIDNKGAPVSGLQKIFLEDYGLKKYAPNIMHLHHFSRHVDRPVYYSLEVPTTMSFSPRSSRITSKMTDLRELKHIMEVLLSDICDGNLLVEETPILNLAKYIDYHFYHSDNDKLNEIECISELAKRDERFTRTVIDTDVYAFPEHSPLLKGCIGISKKV